MPKLDLTVKRFRDFEYERSRKKKKKPRIFRFLLFVGISYSNQCFYRGDPPLKTGSYKE